MIRKALFASLIALGAASTGAALAADEGPALVNRNGSQEVVYDQGRGNVVGGAFATITGGGDNTTYRAAPGARTEESALVGRLSGGGDDEVITYTAPCAAAAGAAGLGGAGG